MSIMDLLESLTKWSELQMTEVDVSDVYVRLGNNFNAVVNAFAAHNIDMPLVSILPISSSPQPEPYHH